MPKLNSFGKSVSPELQNDFASIVAARFPSDERRQKIGTVFLLLSFQDFHLLSIINTVIQRSRDKLWTVLYLKLHRFASLPNKML